MQKIIKITTLLSIIIAIFFTLQPVHSSMSGGNYEIYSDNFSTVSSKVVQGGNYEITQSMGEFFATTTKKGDYKIRSGFQAQEKGILKVTLSKTTLNLGELATDKVSSDSLTVKVTTDSKTGYNLAIREDGDLRSSSGSINDVADGSVTAGSEEYGITTTGTDALLTNDKGISGSVNIASHDGVVNKRATDVVFKASIDSNTAEASYSHKVFFDVTVNP